MLHQSNRREIAHIVLREETRNSLGYPLCYRFSLGGSEENPHFLISVSSAEEQSEITVGTDLLRALDYFHRIVRGGVTPCSLAEIGEDLAYSEIF